MLRNRVTPRKKVKKILLFNVCALIHFLQKTVFSHWSRAGLLLDHPVVRLVVRHHGENGPKHREMVVDCPQWSHPKWNSFFQARQDQEKGMNPVFCIVDAGSCSSSVFIRYLLTEDVWWMIRLISSSRVCSLSTIPEDGSVRKSVTGGNQGWLVSALRWS